MPDEAVDPKESVLQDRVVLPTTPERRRTEAVAFEQSRVEETPGAAICPEEHVPVPDPVIELVASRAHE